MAYTVGQNNEPYMILNPGLQMGCHVWDFWYFDTWMVSLLLTLLKAEKKNLIVKILMCPVT